MAEREPHVHSLAIDKYKQGEDFDLWVQRFEMAVGLAHMVNAPDRLDRKKRLCMEWLPLKIDDATYTTYSNINAQTWEVTKSELSRLLTDPQEKYDYFAGRNQIVWDGKETFQNLFNRIRAKVDKYYEPAARGREYFQRFRFAVSGFPEYRKTIDIGCGENWDVEEAMKIAGRLRVAEGDQASAAAPKAVAFTGASMSDDRIKTLEMGFEGLSLTVGNLVEEQKKNRQSRETSADRDHRQSRSQSRGRDGRDGYDSRGRSDRSPRDSSGRDRRDSNDRRGSPYNRGQDRYRSYDDRGRRGYDDRGRDGSRFRSDRSPSYRRDYDRRGYDRQRFSRSPSRDRQSYDRRGYQSPGRQDNYRRDYYRRDDYRGRRPSWERGDSRDRGRDYNRDYRGRPDSRDRSSRDQGQSNAVAIRDNSRDQPSDGQYRAGSIDYDALAAALTRQPRANLQGN